jgi:hypothetical protein
LKNLSSIILVIFVCSCSNKDRINNASLPREFFSIDYEKILKNKVQINLSQFASNVEYIKLETNDSCLLRPVVNYFFTDSLIFVANYNHILKFDRKGKFLQKIGNSGRGPGEIDLIRIVSIIPKKRLLAVQLNTNRELQFFDFDGEFVKTVKFPKEHSLIKVLENDQYLIYDSGFAGNEAYSFILANEKWDTLSAVENYTKWIHKSRNYTGRSYPEFKEFFIAKDQFYLKDMYNDTVYTIDSVQIKPSYYIDLGKYKLPEELRPERLGPERIKEFKDHINEYYFSILSEASNKIFLRAWDYGETDNKYVLFDKLNKQGVLLTLAGGESKGFVNDWDGGIDFWPIGNVNENQVYMPIDVMSFRKALEENKDRRIAIKFSEKQKGLTDMVSGLDFSANPILMIVTLSK